MHDVSGGGQYSLMQSYLYCIQHLNQCWPSVHQSINTALYRDFFRHRCCGSSPSLSGLLHFICTGDRWVTFIYCMPFEMLFLLHVCGSWHNFNWQSAAHRAVFMIAEPLIYWLKLRPHQHHLRQLRSVRRSLTTDSAKTLVHALIASRLDYCNSVLYQINTTATKTLQSVLHSAARLIVRKRKFERITPTLSDDLHWLPVRERIVFKLCMITFKCRHQTAPQYLQELCVPVTASTSRRHLRSAARGNLQVLACRTTSLGPRSFAACAPKLWNSLPPPIRDPTLTLTFFCSINQSINQAKDTVFSGAHSWLLRL